MVRLTSIERLSTAINDELKLYSASVVKGMKKVNDECMKEFVSDTKTDAPKSNMKRRGTFAKNITSKTTLDTPNRKVNTWYVKDPEYRLTHLIKNGHAKRNGGKVRPKVHIKPVEEKCNNEYYQDVINIIKKGA